MHVLILYHSRYGHTKSICLHIAHILKKAGITCHLQLTDNNDTELLNFHLYTGMIFASPVYYGKHNPKIMTLMNTLPKSKTRIKTALLSINLTARKKNKNTLKTNPYLKKWCKNLCWKPDYTVVIAGALKYPKYRWYERLLIGWIMKYTGGPTDKHQCTDFTNWEEINLFADRFAKDLVTENKKQNPCQMPTNPA